jgi:lipopolysaccharide export system protein LptA
MSRRNIDRFLPALQHRATMALLGLALALPASLSLALPDDREKPIHITADKALRDEKKGVTVYTGHVVLVQGSMELEADTLTIYHTSEKADQIIAEGNPARMRQQPEVKKAIVHAQGKVITYYRSEDKVNLRTDAQIEQDGAVVSGDSIDYFIVKQLITAQSNQSRPDDKVSVVIPPNVQQREKENDRGATESE